MSFRTFNEPGEVLTSHMSFAQMEALLEDWRVSARRELVADAEGMPPGDDTGDLYQRIQKALRILKLARAGEERES